MSETDENVEEIPEDEEEELVEEEEIYDSATFLSGPRRNSNSTFEENILVFDYSFGFTARKYFNLAMPDPDHLLFTAGNLIHTYNVSTNDMSFRRTALGGGIGNIRTNPNPAYSHIAVAENGNKFGAKPLVVIYEWPSLDIVVVLKGGSTASFTNLDYSADGMLLVSQAGDPDYLITIYDWPNRTILLRTKSYINDVYRVKFSETVPGQLCTAGVAHIKFWKMCHTFTGLKLKGEVGRFGKTEYTDIVGVIPMPDEKVVSGCKWGNLLVWEAGLIKVEVMRNNRKPLHEAQIVQLFYIEGELWTVSQDGHIKVWYFEKIDQADPPDHDRVVMMEPSYDFHTPGAMFMSVIKRYRQDPESFHYFAQDGNGGIWLLDCNVYTTPEPSKKLLETHAGVVMGLEPAPHGHYFATLGVGGRLMIYDYLAKKIIFFHRFVAMGSCMIWIPIQLVRSGDEIIAGFEDGNLRVCLIDLSDPGNINLSIIQIIKPHSKSVTAISINPTRTILVSGGADNIIFVFKLEMKEDCIILVPIGLVPSPDTPSYITWKPDFTSTVSVGCLHGFFFEANVPEEPQPYTTISYLLKVKPNCRRFHSYKSQIRRDIEIAKMEAKKAEKVEKKRKDMMKIKEENPGLEIDEDIFLADSESTFKWEPLYYPEVPSDVLWLQYTAEGTIWLSMSGYDAGYIYEYKIDQPEDIPLSFRMLENADDIEVTSFLYNYNRKYIIFGMRDGTIRVNKTNPDDFRDLSDYWTLAMHENLCGFIPSMAFSYDERYFFSCGHDGNVFSYTFNPEYRDYIPRSLIVENLVRFRQLPAIPDSKGSDYLSLEEAMVKAENDRIERVANENKAKYREQIAHLKERFAVMLERNAALPEDQQITRDRLEIDPRITHALHIMMEKKVALVRRKLAFDLAKPDCLLKKLRTYYMKKLDYFPITIHGLLKDVSVSCLRQKRLCLTLFNMDAYVDLRIKEADRKTRIIERTVVETKIKTTKRKTARELEYFLTALSKSTLDMRLDAKFTRLLNKYRTRRAKWSARRDQWREFNALKPVEGENHPDDVVSLNYATANIGDFKLKTSTDYKVTDPKKRETTLKKFQQISATRRKQYDIRHNFSSRVYKLRDEKEEIRQKLQQMGERLKKIHEVLPENLKKFGPIIPPPNEDEYPEKDFQVILKEDEEFEESYMNITKLQDQKKSELTEEQVVENELLQDIQIDESYHHYFENIEYLQYVKNICDYTLPQLMKLSEECPSPWEIELIAFRQQRMLMEQEELIHEMFQLVSDFDRRLEETSKERAQTEIDGLYCDLFLHKLHQELLILRDFEAHEEVLQDKVNTRLTNVLDMEDNIRRVKTKTETQSAAMERNQALQNGLNDQFNKVVHDNKFADFLRKVFKKKYKPPKVRNPDDSSSESSSSSSDTDDEDDNRSIDSRDFGFIRQDLNVCPKGCDPQIFNKTIDLRSERHELEMEVKELQREVEGLKREQELNQKKLRVMNLQLEASQQELTNYQREKQQKLNGVECTIMLRLDQMQHFENAFETSPISECLVFSKTALSKLYKRVGEIQNETVKLKARHLINVKHLSRMRTDLKFMEGQIHDLKQQIIEAIMLKFGKVIKMEALDRHLEKNSFGSDIVSRLMEHLLRKMVHELRLSLIDVKTLYKDEISLWDKKLEVAESEYAEALRENTSRLDLLGLLKKEKLELTKQIANQERKREIVEHRRDTAHEIDVELSKLDKIRKEQDKQIAEMRAEIVLLKSKSEIPPKVVEEKLDVPQKEALEEIQHARGYLYPDAEDDSFDPNMRIPIEICAAENERRKYEITQTIMFDFLANLDIKLEQASTENFIKNIIYPMIDYAEIRDILQEIVNLIGRDLSEEEVDKISSCFEMLKTGGLEWAESDFMIYGRERMKPPKISDMTKNEIRLYVGTIMDDILKDVVPQSADSDYHISLCNIMMRAVEEIPMEILKMKVASDTIFDRITACECFSKDSIDKVKLAEVIETWDECLCGCKDSIDKVKIAEVKICWENKEDIFKRMIEKLLEKAFATGLDIISFHR